MACRRSLALAVGLLVPFATAQSCDVGTIVTTYTTCVQGAISGTGYDGTKLCACVSNYVSSILTCGGVSQAECLQFLQPYFSSSLTCVNACDKVGGSNSSSGGWIIGGITGVPNCTTTTRGGSCLVAGGIYNVNVNYQYSGWTYFSQAGTLNTVGSTINFAAGSNTTFQSQTTFSGSGAVTYSSGSAVTYAESAAVAYRSAATFTGSSVTVSAAATVRFAAQTVVSGCTWSGSGTVIYEAAVSYTMSFSGSVFYPSLYVFGGSQTTSTSRVIDLSAYTTVQFCGATQGPVVVNGTSAVVLQLNCTAAGGQASNTIQLLQFLTSTGQLVLQGPSATSLPSVVYSWTNTSNVPLQVDFTAAGSDAFSTVMLLYGAGDEPAASCPTAVSGTISGCDAGATCSLSGSTYNATFCAIAFSYQPGTSGGSNLGSLAWLGALAILPVVGLPLGYYLYQQRQSAQADFLAAPSTATPLPHTPALAPTPVYAPLYTPYTA